MPKTVVYRAYLEDAPEFTENNLRSAISALLTDDEDDSIVRHIGLFPSCRTQDNETVALIKFAETPRFLSQLARPTTSQRVTLQGNVLADFDRNFSGFTPLNRPDETQGIDADIIALSGIGGHAYGSWANTQDGATFMWLQDALPRHFQNCRIMLYGYESRLDSQSTSRLSDYCMGLHAQLKQVRQNKAEKHRPIIFIAHSFGGIIVANTLLEARLNDPFLYNSIEAFLFFGTPHRGLIVDEIREMLVDPNHPRLDLLGQIDSSNKFLGEELRHFKNNLESRRVFSFYETKLTKQLVKGDDGVWARTGPYLELSSKEGSLLGLSDKQESKFGIDEDHSGMVKFRNRREPAYNRVVDALKEILPGAQGRVLRRSDKEYHPEKLMEWLSDIDFVRWETEKITPTDVVDIGQFFFVSDVYKAWEMRQISCIECYGAVGSGKTYLAYQTARSLFDPELEHVAIRIYIQREHELRLEQILGAMLKQLLRRTKPGMVVSTGLQLYHYENSSSGWPSGTKIIHFINQEVANIGYVYIIIDGLSEAPRPIREDIRKHIRGLQTQHPRRIGVLYFNREDGNSSQYSPYCDACNEEALIHYRCRHSECALRPNSVLCQCCFSNENEASYHEHDRRSFKLKRNSAECMSCRGDFLLNHRCEHPDCTPKQWFDLCSKCFSDPSSEIHHRHDRSSFEMGREVVYKLAPRITEMQTFLSSKIDSLIKSGQNRPSTELSIRRSHLSSLARFCTEDPTLLKSIPECIATKLSGVNFKVAHELFESLRKKNTMDGLTKSLAKLSWRGITAYKDILQMYKDQEDPAEEDEGWKILTMVAVARLPSLPSEDLRVAAAALTEDSLSPSAKMQIQEIIKLTEGHLRIITNSEGHVQLSDGTLFDFFHQYEFAAKIRRKAHSNMAEACVNFLKHKLPELSDRTKYMSNTSFWEEPFLVYATAYWGDHMASAGIYLAPHVSERALELLETTDWLQAYINAAWVSNLRRKEPPQWDVNSGVHALHICAWFGLSDLIRKVQRKNDVDEREATFGQTPLMYACRKGHEEAVDTLLGLGADPALLSDRGHNALFEAVIVIEESPEHRQSKMRIVDRLIKDGRVDLRTTNAKSKYRTVVHIAVIQGHRGLVERLLSYGADPNCFDSRGFTPLMYAARDCKVEMVEALLHHGAHTDAFGKTWPYRTTALHLVVEDCARYEDECKDEHRQIMSELLAHNTDLTLQDAWGFDVVTKAKQLNLDVLELLRSITQRARRCESGTVHKILAEPLPRYMLHFAVSTHCLHDVQDILLSKPSVARAKDQHGRTPLHLAANNCNKHLGRVIDAEFSESVNKILSALIPYSDLSAKDHWGFTAMDYALYNRNVATQILLLEGGAKLDANRHDALNTLALYSYDLQKPCAMRTLLQLGANELEIYSLIVLKRRPTISLEDLQWHKWSADALY